MEDPFDAFCRVNHIAVDGARAGPLRDLTFAVKDVMHIAGARTGFGNPDWLRTHDPAEETASAVRRLLDAGADMVGKTHTDELAYSLTGENVHYGTPRNPRDSSRIPGGSSNGSATAVAGGLVDFALGTDCGGSVRLPASYCGILGIRPTHGRVPVDGVIPFGPSFDVIGWFSREARILREVGTILLDPPSLTAPARRLLLAEDAFDIVDGEVTAALAPAIAGIKKRFGRVNEVVVSAEGLEDWRKVFQTIQAAEVWASLGAWVRATQPRFGPGISERFEAASHVSESTAAQASRRQTDVVAQLDALLGEGDVLCLPTSPRVAPLRNLPMAEVEIAYRNQAVCLLCISGLGGLPQVTLPLAEFGGLPLGVSLIGRRGADEMLLDLAVDLYGGSGQLR